MQSNSKKSIEEQYGITDTDGNPYEIPLKGSIGLLILGYRGLMAWRAKRIFADKNHQQKNNDEGGK